MMLLNKIPCLDKGYVAYIDSSNNAKKLADLSLEFLKSNDAYALSELGTLTIAVKCPLFVQLNFSKFNLKIVASAHSEILESYIPNVSEIASGNLETNKLIADDIERTSAALLINPTAYQQDNCNRFISQVLMPVSTYTTLIVHGSYNEFKKFCDQQNPPGPIKSYTNAVKQIIAMEWK